jgi:hypothetical protein
MLCGMTVTVRCASACCGDVARGALARSAGRDQIEVLDGKIVKLPIIHSRSLVFTGVHCVACGCILLLWITHLSTAKTIRMRAGRTNKQASRQDAAPLNSTDDQTNNKQTRQQAPPPGTTSAQAVATGNSFARGTRVAAHPK